MQPSFKELSPAKLNLFLKIVSKRDDGYHNIRSGVTLINLFDEVIAEKDDKFSVKYTGEFSPQNNKFKDCIVEKIFSKLDIKKPNYAFTIKKNIPIMSGLGSASSNAANMQEPLPVNLAKIVSGRLFINFKRLLISFDCFSKIGSKSFPLSSSLISSVSKFRSKFNLVELI